MKKLNAVALGVLLVTGSGSALGEGFMPWTDIMKMADVNSDQMISPHEVMMFKYAAQYPGFQPFIATHFMHFDADGDGMITYGEFHSEMGTMKMTEGDMTKAFSTGIGFMPWDNRKS